MVNVEIQKLKRKAIELRMVLKSQNLDIVRSLKLEEEHLGFLRSNLSNLKCVNKTLRTLREKKFTREREISKETIRSKSRLRGSLSRKLANSKTKNSFESFKKIEKKKIGKNIKRKLKFESGSKDVKRIERSRESSDCLKKFDFKSSIKNIPDILKKAKLKKNKPKKLMRSLSNKKKKLVRNKLKMDFFYNRKHSLGNANSYLLNNRKALKKNIDKKKFFKSKKKNSKLRRNKKSTLTEDELLIYSNETLAKNEDPKENKIIFFDEESKKKGKIEKFKRKKSLFMKSKQDLFKTYIAKGGGDWTDELDWLRGNDTVVKNSFKFDSGIWDLSLHNSQSEVAIKDYKYQNHISMLN